MRLPENLDADHVKASSFIGVLLILASVLGLDAVLIGMNWL